MRSKLMPTAIALMGLFILAATPLQAKDRGRGDGHRKSVAVDSRATTGPVRVIHLNDSQHRERDRRRAVVLFPRIDLDARQGRPPGWDRGRKVGWGNCDLPPGLAKKVGCYNRFFDRRVIRTPWNRRNRGVVISLPFVGYFRLQ